MRDDTSRSTDGTRALRRWSLLRRAWCDADLPNELIEICLEGNPDRLLFSSIPLQVKDKCLVARYERDADSLLVKRHIWGSLSRTLRMAFRVPAARSCAEYGIMLNERGVPTPKPRASILYRFGPWTHRSYLITDYVEGTSLYRYIRFGSQAEDELQHIAAQVANIWQRLVELDVSHNDFKPENFIVDENRKVWLIDLEKVRVGGDAQRQISRQTFDVVNFLHIRNWRHRAEARAFFAEAFMQTSFRDSKQAASVERIASQAAPLEAESDVGLSVLIRCDGGIEMALAAQAIDSVHDIADEVLLVEAAADGSLKVVDRISICEPPTTLSITRARKTGKGSATQLASNPWILAIHQNESVTPFLAKELQQRIADTKSIAAYRMPLKQQYFGKTMAHRTSDNPLRLFLADQCDVVTDDSGLHVTVPEDRTATLEGSILSCECATVADFVDRLNERTTHAALNRLQAAEPPHLVETACRTFAKLVGSLLRPRVWRDGWAGLQMAAIESGFGWVEEAKLYQLTGEFRRQATTQEATALTGPSSTVQLHESPTISRSKAA